MAVTRVTFTSTQDWGGTSYSTVTSPTFINTAGNLIVVCIGGYAPSGQAVTGVTDSAGNTYTKVDHVFEASDQYRQEIWYAKAIAAHAGNAVAATWSATVQYVSLVAIQYAGASPTAPLEGSAKGTAAAGNAIATTGTLTTTSTDAVHVLFGRWGHTAYTYPAGFTELSGVVANGKVAEKFVTAAFSGTYSVNHGTTSGGKLAMTAAFAAAVAPPAGVEHAYTFIGVP